MASSANSNWASSMRLAMIGATLVTCLGLTNTRAQADNSKTLSGYYQAGIEALKANQQEKCKQYISLLKGTKSGAPAANVLESQLLCKHGHFKEALALVNQSLKSQPNSASLLAQRAVVYGYTDNEEQSFNDYIAASKCSNMTSDDCYTIAKGLSEYDKWDEAIAVAQIGIKQKQANGALYALAGDVARKLKKLDLAEQYIEKAIAIGPAKASTFQELASLHKVMKKWSAVINDCKRLKQVIADPDKHLTYARCLEMSGEAHIELKQDEEAVVDFSNAIKISPLKSSILKQRASAYEKLGKKTPGAKRSSRSKTNRQFILESNST
jgi:tetratricopeptide (TPR) repeat protein